VVVGGFKIEDRLLNVGAEVGKAEELRYADTGDAGGAGDLGLVFHLAHCQEMLVADSKLPSNFLARVIARLPLHRLPAGRWRRWAIGKRGGRMLDSTIRWRVDGTRGVPAAGYPSADLLSGFGPSSQRPRRSQVKLAGSLSRLSFSHQN
jgi:hypothetical protein